MPGTMNNKYSIDRPFDTMRAKIRFWFVVVMINLINIPGGAICFATVWFVNAWAYWNTGVRWMGYYLNLAGMKIRTIGAEKIRRDRPVVFISNHLSHLDICACMKHLPVRLHFIAKKELLRVPIFGWALVPLGMYMIDRSTTDKAYESIKKAARNVREKNECVLIYPEGGISRTGKIQPFKKGAFTLAIEAGVPIVPLLMKNTGALFSVPRMECRPGSAEIHVLDPIPTEGYTSDTKEELMKKVYAAMKNAQESQSEA